MGVCLTRNRLPIPPQSSDPNHRHPLDRAHGASDPARRYQTMMPFPQVVGAFPTGSRLMALFGEGIFESANPVNVVSERGLELRLDAEGWCGGRYDWEFCSGMSSFGDLVADEIWRLLREGAQIGKEPRKRWVIGMRLSIYYYYL